MWEFIFTDSQALSKDDQKLIIIIRSENIYYAKNLKNEQQPIMNE